MVKDRKIIEGLLLQFSISKKQKAKEVFNTSKIKRIVVEESKSNSKTESMIEIKEYEDSSTQESDDVESSDRKSYSGDMRAEDILQWR